MQFKFDKKYFHSVKTNIICHMLIMALISGLFAFSGGLEVFGYTEKTGTVVNVNSTSTLNVRSGPGTTYDRVGAITNGYVVTIRGEEYAANGALWYKISYIDSSGAVKEGYAHSDYIQITDNAEYEPDADFEAYMTAQGFPETYKEGLRKLHTKYPNWVFVADKINYDWNEVVNNQSVIGRSLVTKNAISSWKSLENGAYDWTNGAWVYLDGNAWVAASKEIIAYYLDPRNFLNETYIFQFTSLSYNSVYETAANLSTLVKGTFLASGSITDDETGSTSSYINVILKAAQKSGVSAFYLASSIIQEIGSAGTSGSISGNYGGYIGLYNYYNWGASSASDPILLGLQYASQTDASTLRPWNTRYKSIVGGAYKFSNGYIKVGQDTAYYKKFDFVGTPYTHQYMTNIQAAASEGNIIGKGYSDSIKKTSALVFKIPIFNNMPETAVAIPTGDGSPSNCLETLTVSMGSLTPTFNYYVQEYDVIVANDVSSININAAAFSSNASVSGTGNHSLAVGSNRIEVVVTAQNGSPRTYTINVVREKADTPSGGDDSGGTVTTPVPTVQVTGYTIDDTNKYVKGIAPDTDIHTLISKVSVTNGSVKLLDKDGREKSGTAATSDIIRIYDNDGKQVYQYTVIVAGDANGDGKVTVKDALLVRKHIMGTSKLSGCYLAAGDVNNGNDGVTVKDALIIRKHIMGTSLIK